MTDIWLGDGDPNTQLRMHWTPVVAYFTSKPTENHKACSYSKTIFFSLLKRLTIVTFKAFCAFVQYVSEKEFTGPQRRHMPVLHLLPICFCAAEFPPPLFCSYVTPALQQQECACISVNIHASVRVGLMRKQERKGTGCGSSRCFSKRSMLEEPRPNSAPGIGLVLRLWMINKVYKQSNTCSMLPHLHHLPHLFKREI